MVIYNIENVINFYTYGIQVPSAAARMEKTYASLLAAHGCSAAHWGRCFIPACISGEDLSLVHSRQYLHSLFTENGNPSLYRAYELLNSDGTYNRYEPERASRPLITIQADILAAVCGTYHTLVTALETGFAFFLGGGMHHAHRDFGHGFCPVNDIAVAVRKAQSGGVINTAWIIDTDAHRGDGTADIFLGDDSVRTLSIHMARGWPLDSPEYYPDGTFNRSYAPGDIDIGIESGDERTYNEKLREALRRLESFPRPDVAVVVAGADPYEKDQLPSSRHLNLTHGQMVERDMLVYDFLNERSIPSAWLAAGGYGDFAWEVQSAFLSNIIPLRCRPTT